ncbi:serine/threonine-protein kinase [Longispora albida]|uniref:serine/threonine-protein kinase n=1 Tax=Longispora albida TaxID=203523 RepID=UPI00039C4A3F|nr:serine/threonine-protein kinase [Longispora albida]
MAWSDEAMSVEQVTEWRRAAADRSGLLVAVVSMSEFAPDAVECAAAAGPGLVLLDRSHVEAALCGLMSLPEIIEKSAGRAAFQGTGLTSVTELLTEFSDSEPPSFVSPTRYPAPWDLEVSSPEDVEVRHVLSGERGLPARLSGIAVDGDRILVSSEEGVFEIDRRSGISRWVFQVAGCTGAPLIASDGRVLIRRGPAVLEWENGRLSAIAGELDDARSLFWGPGEQPWVLCGRGGPLEAEGATLGLAQLSRVVGEQQRHPISFHADVLNAGWLGDLRFFLAAQGHSAVIDLTRSTLVRQEDWIVSPNAPHHLVIVGPNEVITASGNHTGIRGDVFRTTIDSGTSELIANLQVNRIDGLAATPTGPLLILGDVRGNDLKHPRPVLIKLTQGNLREAPLQAMSPADQQVPRQAVTSAEGPTPEPRPDADLSPYDAVQFAGRGQRGDYRLDGGHRLGTGGQAKVLAGVHKQTGLPIAFKELRFNDPDSVARLRREVYVGSLLRGHPNVMPVLDSSFTAVKNWMVMPRAAHSAEAVALSLRDTGNLRELVTAVCAALDAAHQLDVVHRDLKPENILWLDGRWVVSDWGLVRRPRGQTTKPGRTRIGEQYGTKGFAAPELSVDAHEAGPQADIYAVGQIIGWAIRQEQPQANIALLPDSGPWRTIARAATRPEPGQRPATITELLALISHELDPLPEEPASRGAGLLAAAEAGDTSAPVELFRLAAASDSDHELYTQVLVKLDDDAIRRAIDADAATVLDVVKGVLQVSSGGYISLQYTDIDQFLYWLLRVAHQASEFSEWDLFEGTADVLFDLDESWDQWTPQRNIRAWLTSLRGDAASLAARALKAHSGSIPHFQALADEPEVDHRIRKALAGS